MFLFMRMLQIYNDFQSYSPGGQEKDDIKFVASLS